MSACTYQFRGTWRRRFDMSPAHWTCDCVGEKGRRAGLSGISTAGEPRAFLTGRAHCDKERGGLMDDVDEGAMCLFFFYEV